MRVCVLDLEMNQPSGKIIEVGYVILDTDTGKLVDEPVSLIVDPHEELDPFIVKLTSITQEDVDAGCELHTAYEHLVADMNKHQCCKRIVQWGNGDVAHLKLEMTKRKLHPGYDFDWNDIYDQNFNAKIVYQSWAMTKGLSIRSGLAKSMTRMGLKFEGTKHRAVDDAYNTARIFMRLLAYFRTENVILDKGNIGQ